MRLSPRRTVIVGPDAVASLYFRRQQVKSLRNRLRDQYPLLFYSAKPVGGLLVAGAVGAATVYLLAWADPLKKLSATDGDENSSEPYPRESRRDESPVLMRP